MSILLFFDHPYPPYIPTAGSTTLPYPVNCVMEILRTDFRPSDAKLSKGLFKSIFRE